ncbi:MAG: MerR family transcriptional regulator [Ktedonobacteraceae bacterium]|nr:MerR family transcriptional regulator [Ktedonobacteraceae bacterium]
MEKDLTIQQVAHLTGLSEYTLRYYEREGLLDPVSRADNGHRRYAAHDLAWIDFLKRLRATGMPIQYMREFADLRRCGASSIHQRRLLLEAHRQAVQERMQDLARHVAAIDEKIRHYKELEIEHDRTTGTPTAGADAI